MLTVTMMLWWDPQGKRNHIVRYGAQHVNLLKRQVDRHLTLPHEFVLICDGAPDGLDAGIRAVPLDRRTHVAGMMYAKLMLFRRDVGEVVGRRIFYLDLDTVVTGNIDRIAGRPEPLVLWQHPYWGRDRAARYNSSVMLMDGGCRPDVYEAFDPLTHPAAVTRHFNGHDQAWIAERVGDDAAVWTTEADGIYLGRKLYALPANARIVTFPGMQDPGQSGMAVSHPWISRHRR